MSTLKITSFSPKLQIPALCRLPLLSIDGNPRSLTVAGSPDVVATLIEFVQIVSRDTQVEYAIKITVHEHPRPVSAC